ncbi:MAG: flagellar biosynthesis protein FlhB [Campylobacterota bacterium]|nr:flagellar biosynthesis protein FlhB [Campylobacterota bacterium]
MADEEEKTEEPTGKKIDDAKKEGNVPKSAEVPGASILFFSSIYLLFFAGNMFSDIKDMIIYIYSFIGTEMSGKLYYTITSKVVTQMLYALFPLFFLVLFLAVIFNLMQFGFIATPLKLELNKINPISGFKNVFSMKKAIEALKLTAKLIIIFIVMLIILAIIWDDILSMMDKNVEASLEHMIQLTIYFLLTILLIIIIFAIIDFFFTRHYYFKQLKMSKQEVKDEHKQMEGDPLVKGRIRQIQMKMAKQRMMSDVPDADVVITNPTHYAVALKYDNEKSSAPVVLAKGIDFLALKIKDIARDSKIPIIEDPALARALYEQIEVEEEIPEVFYKAIAEIFTYIYNLNGKGQK